MGTADHFQCALYKREFVKDFLIQYKSEYICCMLYELFSKGE